MEMEEEDKRMHTIRIDADTELSLRIPDIMDLDDLNSIVEKTSRLKELTTKVEPKKESKAVSAANKYWETRKKNEKKSELLVPKKQEKVLDMERACREYLSAPWGGRNRVAEKYGINLETLKYNVRRFKEGGPPKPEEPKREIIKGDLWHDYQNAPFGKRKVIARKYGLTLGTLRTNIYQIRKKLGISKEQKKREHPENAYPVRKNKVHSDETVEKMVELLKLGSVSLEVAQANGFKNPKHVYDIVFNRTGKRIRELRM